MTIFDIISDIAFTKKSKHSDELEDDSVFIPYMVNRWLSMYSPSIANVSNVVNRYLTVFDDKQTIYRFFVNVFPKIPPKRIAYIKKQKPEKKENNNLQIAHNMELSEREIEQYIDFLDNSIN